MTIPIEELEARHTHLMVACQAVRDEMQRLGYCANHAGERMGVFKLSGVSQVLHFADLEDQLRDLQEQQADAWIAYKRAQGMFVEN